MKYCKAKISSPTNLLTKILSMFWFIIIEIFETIIPFI